MPRDEASAKRRAFREGESLGRRMAGWHVHENEASFWLAATSTNALKHDQPTTLAQLVEMPIACGMFPCVTAALTRKYFYGCQVLSSCGVGGELSHSLE